MTLRADATRPSYRDGAARTLMSASGAIVVLLCVVPPFATWARHYAFVEALQFCVLGVVAPALIVLGAPWSRAGAARRRGLSSVRRWMIERSARPATWRAVVVLCLYLATVVLWRTPWAVNALARQGWPLAIEAITLLPVGVLLWLDLVESPPSTPRLTHPQRMLAAAIAMWTIWILAYLVGLSHSSWFSAYHHHAGSGVSLSADQQLMTGVMWVVSGCAFIPVIFWNLVKWLQSEDEESVRQQLQVLRRRLDTTDAPLSSPASS